MDNHQIAVLNNPLVITTQETGSRFICNPAPTDTDEDHIVLVTSLEKFGEELQLMGWQMDSEEAYPDDEFNSFRSGDLNLIVTDSLGFFNSMRLATQVCKHLNVLDKQHRIVVFDAIQKGTYEENIE